MDVGGLGCFDEFGMYPFTVVRSDNRIFGYYGGVTRCESVPFNTAIGGAISVDGGETFTRMGQGPIISYSHDEPFAVGSPKVRIFGGKWYMFYVAGKEWVRTENRPEVYYKLRMATSEDGITWVKHGKDIISDKIGATEAQASGDVTFSNGKYHMFFCYRANLDFRRNSEYSYRIGYAVSDDLFTWTRMDKLAAIDVSQENDVFDNEMVAYPHVFEVDGKAYMLYLGNEVGKYGFGIAELEGELS
jgi:sucrose-6-phosphate hydrolase SacC (GH32 family)